MGHMEEDRLEPIAVIGFSFKYPQDAISPDAFWEIMRQGRCVSSDFPADRLNADAFYHPDYSRHDSFHFKGGHFLKEDLGSFDAPFFAISPSEAIAMDPHQRKLLEVAYRALENAGLPVEKVAGSQTSVYTASFADDYRLLLHRDAERLPTYALPGTIASFLANRISWFYDFKAESIHIDTACSSSLVAVDRACQSLRNRDSNMSIVTGGNIILDPANMIALSNLNFLSPDSRSFSFDHRANGYAQGEGVGVVVLQRLSDAIRDNNCIRAVIRSTGSNFDGKTSTISQPSHLAQEELIRNTYLKAGLSLKHTRYFEAHATGTAVGDPIEAKAIGAVFSNERKSGEPLYVGAVKSNIGHLEGGSGLAGLIKTILVLEKGLIPPNANFEKVNPKINPAALNIVLPQKLTPWPTNGLRRASINSFGFGGTNSHVVIEDAYNHLRFRSLNGCHRTIPCASSTPITRFDWWSPKFHKAGNVSIGIDSHSSYNAEQINDDSDGTSTEGSATSINFEPHTPDTAYSKSDYAGDNEENKTPRLLVWSAGDRDCVERVIRSYGDHFSKGRHVANQENFLDDLAHTLAMRRSSLLWKSFAVVKSTLDLRGLSMDLISPVKSLKDPTLAFVFTGQGSNWPQMGRELLRYPRFSASMVNADEYLKTLGCHQWSLLDELGKDALGSSIHKPSLSQPLCTAIQIALVDLLRSFSISPSVVSGHSSGEIAAAYTTGAISAQSAWKTSYYRGLLSESLCGQGLSGAMVSVGIGPDQTQLFFTYLMSRFENCDVVVACINSPKSVTLSGPEDQILALVTIFDEKGIFNRRLSVNVAYHSPQMFRIASEYKRLMGTLERGLAPQKPCAMISSLKARVVEPDEVRDSQYWVDNLTMPVRFSEAIMRLCPGPSKSDGAASEKVGEVAFVDSILEIGPQSTLRGPIKETLKSVSRAGSFEYYSCMKPLTSASETLLTAVGGLYCRGHQVDLSKVNEALFSSYESPNLLVDLPEYPFDDSRTYWPNTLQDTGYRFRGRPRNDLLGTRSSDWNPLDARWHNLIKPTELSWVKDHVVNGTVIYPGAGMIAMAIEASRQTFEDGEILGFEIRNVMFQKPLVIPSDTTGVEVSFTLRRLRDGPNNLSSWSEFVLCTYENGQWTENCRGTITVAGKLSERSGNVEELTLELQDYRKRFRAAKKHCSSALQADTVYKYLRDCGLEYGPEFQLLHDVSTDNGDQVTSKINLYTESLRRAGPQTPDDFVVHPTTLDAFFHMLYLGLAAGCTRRIPTSVPTNVQRLWVSNEGLNSSAGGALKAVSTVSRLSPQLERSSLFALSDDDNALLLVAEGLETTVVAEVSTHASLQSNEKQRFHCYHWKPDVSLMSNQQIHQYIQHGASRDAEPRDFYEDLTLLLLMFVTETLQQITDSDSAWFEYHQKKYIEWMRSMERRFWDGSLPDTQSSWKERLSDATHRAKLCDNIRSYPSGLAKLILEIGSNLSLILNCQTSIHEIMFAGDLAERTYHEMYTARRLKHSYSKYLDAVAHKHPTMRILEIGAGTGGASAMTLDILTSGEGGCLNAPRYGSYDFTDISPSFFERARERLPEHASRLNFKLFDVQCDPTDQGFEVGSYDMIIAFGSIHIAKNLGRALCNARKLLKPGGKLILGEITRPHILRSSFVFGLFPDWWLSSEKFRETGPCISEERWNEALSQSGFSGNDLVIHDFEDEMCREVSIIVSTAVNEPTKASISRISIVVDGSSDEQITLAGLLSLQLREDGSDFEIGFIEFRDLCSSRDTDMSICVFLLEYDHPMLENIDADQFSNLQSAIIASRAILWVTGGGSDPGNSLPGYGVINGLSRTLRNENENLRLVTVALDRSENASERHAHHISRILNRILLKTLDGDFDQEYVEKDKLLGIHRLVESCQVKDALARDTELQETSLRSIGSCPPLKLSIKRPGRLESLEYVEDKAAPHIGSDEVEIKVKAVGISIVDCLAAMGRYKQGWLGGDCSGTVIKAGENSGFEEGDNVAFVGIDSFRTTARSPSAVKIPPGMSFTEAAAVPLSFVLAWYALKEVARIRPGESVLIHSATCGVGQACLQVSRYLGADIFVTTGSAAKAELLSKLFNLPTERILSCSDPLFAKSIMRLTTGRGVDVVLNALDESGSAASWDCIASFGRFIEVGPDTKCDQSRLRLRPSSSISYHTTDFRTLVNLRPKLVQSILVEIMDLIATEKLHIPEMLHVYPSSKVEVAFGDLLKRENTGKTILTIADDDVVKTVLDRKPAYSFDSNSTFLIAGGLGTCGRIISQWMVARGARNLILLSRSGGEKFPDFLESLRIQGVHVETPACDVSSRESLQWTLSNVEKKMPPIKGCINAAVVIKDLLFEKMTFEDWDHVTAPKIRGSWNLHTLLPKDMDFFILLTSMAAAVGFNTQANYSAANTYQDALAQFRVANGQRAASLNLGPINEDGPSTRNPIVKERIFNSGNHILQSGKDLCDLLDHYCNPHLAPSRPPTHCQLLMGINDPFQIRAERNREEPNWMRAPLFSHFYTRGKTASLSHTTNKVDIAILLTQSTPGTAASVIIQALIEKLSSIISIPVDNFDEHKPIHAYGIDSLVAVDLRNWLSKQMRADVAIFDVMGSLSIKAFGELVAIKSLYCQSGERVTV